GGGGKRGGAVLGGGAASASSEAPPGRAGHPCAPRPRPPAPAAPERRARAGVDQRRRPPRPAPPCNSAHRRGVPRLVAAPGRALSAPSLAVPLPQPSGGEPPATLEAAALQRRRAPRRAPAPAQLRHPRAVLADGPPAAAPEYRQ